MATKRVPLILILLALVLGIGGGVAALAGSNDSARNDDASRANEVRQAQARAVDNPATECLGFKVTIFALEDDTTYQGTPGDDIVAQAGTSHFQPNGGNDLICTVDGKPLSVSLEDPALVDLSQEELERRLPDIIDADRADE